MRSRGWISDIESRVVILYPSTSLDAAAETRRSKSRIFNKEGDADPGLSRLIPARYVAIAQLWTRFQLQRRLLHIHCSGASRICAPLSLTGGAVVARRAPEGRLEAAREVRHVGEAPGVSDLADRPVALRWIFERAATAVETARHDQALQ